jgi:hypothetical protein
VRVDPGPIQMIMGNLSDIPRVLSAISVSGTINCVVGGYDANINEVCTAEKRVAEQKGGLLHA